MNHKKCSKCQTIQPLTSFSKDKKSKDGLESRCKGCRRVAAKAWQAANKDRVKAYSAANKDRVKIYLEANKERISKAAKVYREANKDRISKVRKERYAANKDRYAKAMNEWREAHPELVKEYGRRTNKKKRSTPKGKLHDTISHRMFLSLKGSKGGRTWPSLVGYTVEQLKKHLEKQFKPGMTWENYGHYWHIDHRTPVAAFNFESPDDIDFKRCWALKNLQPLPARENMRKGARIERPFQPALAISVATRNVLTLFEPGPMEPRTVDGRVVWVKREGNDRI